MWQEIPILHVFIDVYGHYSYNKIKYNIFITSGTITALLGASRIIQIIIEQTFLPSLVMTEYSNKSKKLNCKIPTKLTDEV